MESLFYTITMNFNTTICINFNRNIFNVEDAALVNIKTQPWMESQAF